MRNVRLLLLDLNACSPEIHRTRTTSCGSKDLGEPLRLPLLDILIVKPPGRLRELGRRGRGGLPFLGLEAGIGSSRGGNRTFLALEGFLLGGLLGLRLRERDGLEHVRRRGGAEAGLAVLPADDPRDQRLRGRGLFGRRGLREGDVEVRGGGGGGGRSGAEEEGWEAAAYAEHGGGAGEERVEGDGSGGDGHGQGRGRALRCCRVAPVSICGVYRMSPRLRHGEAGSRETQTKIC